MKLTKINIILLSIIAVSIITSGFVTYNKGCSVNNPCMGPLQVRIIGIPFSINILGAVFFPLIIGLLSGISSLIVAGKIKKKSIEEALNIGIKSFSISYLIIMIVLIPFMYFGTY